MFKSREKSSLVGSGWGDTTGEEHNTFEVLNPYYDPEEYKDWDLVVRRNLARVNEDKIDYELLEQLVLYINAHFREGCILVFLPGKQFHLNNSQSPADFDCNNILTFTMPTEEIDKVVNATWGPLLLFF